MAKDGFHRQKSIYSVKWVVFRDVVLVKVGLADVFRICFWPLRHDGRSGALIGTDGTRRSDWPVRV